LPLLRCRVGYGKPYMANGWVNTKVNSMVNHRVIDGGWRMAKRARKPPSRVRYEQGHPTVSCRVPREIYGRLKAVMEAKGQSFSDVLKVGLGLLEVQAKQEAEVRKQGYAAGYRNGCAVGERLYKVTYPCSVCRKTLAVTNEEEKEAISEYMQEQGWGHGACHQKRQ